MGRGTKPPTRRERRKREVHDRILGAALELFENRGLRATRIDDICERADVAQKTFFNHFPSRRHLVEEIAEVLFVQLEEIVEECRHVPGGTGERIGRFFESIAAHAEGMGPMHRDVIREVIHSSNVTRSQGEKTRRVIDALRRLIDRPAQTTSETVRDPQVLAELVLNSFLGLMVNWSSVENYPLRLRAAQTAMLFRNGVPPARRSRRR